ncbi:MAG TPA: hypothetical protein ENN21_00680 [Spirochaetes bacterium]|nr:hypothetical protein [Spirochaetota bacterium]
MSPDNRENTLEKIKNHKARFLTYNGTKLGILHSSITSPDILGVFEAIPFFLSVNQSGLPGYINFAGMATGIYNYTPSQRAITFLRGQFPSATLSVPKDPKPFIQMFALMGSGGTIAYNELSDFDFWVCMDEKETSIEALRLFKLKCRLIENWIAEKFNLEVHFFLNDISKVRKNIFDEEGDEGLEGTSLGRLLKEEFFRSSILVAGKIPFWWVTPVGADDAVYGAWLSAADNSYMAQEFIDLGNLYAISRADFLVAALFQLLKSLGNPFKSIMKLGVLERYLHSGSESPFISDIVKRNVHEGRLGLDDIDSYVIMFNHLYSYYNSLGTGRETLDLIESSFYLKVDPRLSDHLKKNGGIQQQNPKTQKMLEYAKKWGWAASDINRMDNFENLDIDQVTRLMNETKKFILRGYKSILNSVESTKLNSVLAQKELRGITQKIFSHFSVSANKIDNTLSFKNYPKEKLLHIEFIRDRDGKEYWILSKRVILDNRPAKIILHKEMKLLGIIAWLSLNRLYQKDYTRLEVDPGIFAIDPNYIRELVADLTLRFSVKKVALHKRYFLSQPFPVTCYVVINPYSKYSRKIDDIVFLYHNSWGETRFEEFKNESDLVHVYSQVLKGGVRTGLDVDTALRMSSSQPYGASREFDRLRFIIRDAYQFFTDGAERQRKRYVTVLGNKYTVLGTKNEADGETVVGAAHDSEIKMLYGLSYNTGAMSLNRADPHVPELNYLAAMFENARDNAVRIYFQKAAKYCYFFVTDERKSFYFYRQNAEQLNSYLARLYFFAENAVKRVMDSNPASPLAKNINRIEVFRLERDIKHNVALTPFNPELDRGIMDVKKSMIPLKLILQPLQEGGHGYRFTLPDGRETGLFGRGSLMSVLQNHGAALLRTPGYGTHVTDMDLSALPSRQYRDATSFYFTEKNVFELLLEQGLRALGGK